ncbi:class I SAM-dependent methyltransferase [Streptomyces sp. AHU1]|uniref:class I SAM-dependent methyltransferase n=1 Tax=Streptomyces sp. AHU1 TaxID=3377215 RepID=UPI0038779A67
MVETGEHSHSRPDAPPVARQPVAGVQEYYAKNAGLLSQRYGSVSFEEVHGKMLDLLPPTPAVALDVGAGTGRDAAALARRGYQVVAVEPACEMREVARRLYPGEGISWVEDFLPELPQVDGSFDLVLLSAVWMHLPSTERGRAMERMAALLAPAGLLVISLRRGDPPPDRVMFDVPADDVVRDAERAGLRLVRLIEERTDRLGRAEVWWQTVALRKGEA